MTELKKQIKAHSKENEVIKNLTVNLKKRHTHLTNKDPTKESKRERQTDRQTDSERERRERDNGGDRGKMNKS